MSARSTRHAPGASIVVRTVTNARIRWASPAIAVTDTPDRIAYLMRGRRRVVVTQGALIGTTLTRREREVLLRQELLDGSWKVVKKDVGSDAGVGTLTTCDVGDWFSVKHVPDGSGRFVPAYVNIERPLHRTPIGFDADDLCLDIVLDDQLAWSLKDADDFDERCRLGVYSAQERDAVLAARDAAIARIEARAHPFDGTWRHWRPDPEWPVPTLPVNWSEGAAW
jgi:hypothetical protein